ncbi:MAG: hypothetical protein QHI48_10390 [Bacteroidota bacterium]|nr:hypothetical protein [Bacteroidota bacterium]
MTSPPPNRPMRNRLAGIVLISLLASHAAAHAQTTPPANEILRRVRGEFERIDDYRADVHIVARIPRVNVPPMDATVYYKKPDRFHIEAKGFAMLPRDAISFNPMLFTEEMYDAVVQGEEIVDGIRCHKVKLLAKSDTLRLQRAMLFVDPTRWIVLRMAADPARGSSADIRFTYAFIQNRWLLPSRVVIEIDAGPTARLPNKPGAPALGDDEKESQHSRIVMTYTNYSVNKGIPDSVFSPEHSP